jgi:hypothetical protein
MPMVKKCKSLTLLTLLFLAYPLCAKEIETLERLEVVGIYEGYECGIDTVYALGRGESTTRKGGSILVTIIGKEVEIKSNTQELTGGNLKLVIRSDVEIVAVNSSMQFTYGVQSNKFNLTTGNGGSKFRSDRGHLGKQKLTYGKCTKT